MAGRDFSAELFGPSAGRDFSSELFGAKPPEKQSAFRQVADVPLGIAKGAVQGVRMIADAFGAGSDTSNTIKSAETYLADLMSAQAKNDQQEISRIMKDAEDKGVLDQVKAAVKAFTVAPVDTLSSALGTAAPVIVGALGAKVLGAGALLTTGVSALTGAGMGAGVIKGSIYEETKRTLKAAGASEEEAERRAQLAQQYNGKNLDQILLGTVLGGAAAVGPLEKGAAGILARRILGKTEGAETVAEQTAKGALRRRAEAGLLEAVPEAVQAGQEKVAENIALQREGFDVPTFRGAAGAATLEAIAGGGLGATLGGGKPAVAPEAPAPVAPPVAPPPVSEAPPAPPVAPPVEPPAPPVAPPAEPPVTPPAPPAPFTAPGGFVSSLTLSPAYEGIEPLSVEDADFELEALQNSAEKGRLTPEQFAGSEIGKRLDTAQLFFVNEGLRTDPVGTITALRDRLKEATAAPPAPSVEPAPVVEAAAPAEKPTFEPKIVSRLSGADGMEVHVFTTTDGYGTGLFDADAQQYVNGSITRFAGTDTLPKAENKAAELLSKATPAEKTPAEPLGTRKEAQAFGKAIGATQPYPGELRGRVNLPAQKAAKEGNFQGVLSALEKSKNVIVAEIAKRARALGTKIVIDDDAEETYTGPSTLMRQMSIDGAKMHLEALNKIREFAPQVDALPDKAPLNWLGFTIRNEKIKAFDNGKEAGNVRLEDIAKMGHSMFAPLSTGPFEIKTKEDFKRLQKAYEDLTSEYGENALQLTSTGSAQMTGVAGVYDANTDTIRVPEYTAKREEVLSHEIVHAQTVQAIASPTLRQKPIVARLNKLYEHVKKELEGRPGRAPYGIQSIQEFVAEGMGNPAFQFLLKKIKYENTSAWDSFVQTIANLIGVKRDTAFTELLSIYSELTTEQKAAPKAPAVEAPAAEPAEPPPAKAAAIRKQPNTVMGSTMLADVSNRLGGLDLSLLSEFSTKFLTKRKDKYGRPMTMWRNPLIKGVGKLFRKGGESDYVLIATMLEEAGYLESGSVERDYKEAGERAKELIKAALNRQEVTTLEQQEQQDQADEEANRQAWQEQQEELKTERDKAAREAGLTPYEGDLLTDDDIDLFPTEAQTDEQYAAGMRAMGFDETEIADAVQKKQERERAQKAAPGRPAEARAVPEVGEGAEGLASYTPEEVTRKQKESEQAAAAEKKAKAAEQERLRKEQQAKEEKARADESAKDFELGKSAEEQMTGMGDLFKRKSLGGAKAQRANFEQTLRTLLNKFGLKDVGLSIIEGMQDAGSYAQQLIRIADRADNPIRTLRHEAIHALRELGFFTDAQWKSLSKMAKDKWVDQYLKQRNVDGKPLKAGEESRYDAYMREYNGDMEKITEEAVADAFADFDASKPPAGLLQALLKRMKDLFQSIKSALTKVESVDQIFGKVEEGKLKPGEKAESGERKSVRDRATANFLRWFGDSKVVDEKGEPLVVYHGSAADFNVFKPFEGLYGKGAYFFEDPKKASEYAGYAAINGPRGDRRRAGGSPVVYPVYIRNATQLPGGAWIVSKPIDIKSAIGNNGDYSLTNPDIRKSIGGVKQAAQKALQKQPMPEKGLGHVSPELTNLAQPIFFPQNKTILDRIDGMKDKFWQRLAQGTADQFRTIKEYSPVGYMQARLSKSIDGSLEGLLFHGQVFDDGGALNIKKNTKGMMEILKSIGNELDSYLMWVALNRESRLPEPKRSKIPNMDKLVARRAEFAAGELNGKPRVEVYQDILKQMNQLNKSVLDIALKKGLIDQEGYDNFSNDIYYIPFYKKMEEDGTVEGAKTASGLTSQDFSKELKGSEAPFGDLMENIVRNWSHILSASMKNAAAQTTLNDAMELQAAEPNLKAGLEMRDGVVYSTKNDKPIAAKFDEDGKQLYAEGVLRPDLTTGGTGMAKIMVDGQPMYFKVTDELLMESISSIGYMGPKSKFLDVMRDFKNMLQFGVTASPIFKVNNLIRDSVSAMAVSDLKKSPVYNVMTGISLSKKDSPTYISALAGGAIFNFGSAYEGDQAKLIKRLLDQGVEGETILDSPDKIKKALKKTWDAYQELGNRSEAANRLSLYQQMRDKGMSHLEASFMARDLLDFSMQGSWGTFRFLTQVVPFMNARIQGLYKLGRDGINPTVRVLYNATTGKQIDPTDKAAMSRAEADKIRAAQFATVTSAVMLASALLYLTFKDDEDYKKRDAWDRDNFWWFKIPSLDIAFRIPKPFEVGAFGTLVERTLEQILDEGAEGKQFGESLNRTLWDTFALNPMPQIFKPLSDIYANKDSFSGAPIESAGLERLSKPERMTDMTSPLGIALSRLWSSIMPEKFEASPVQMDYAIKGYFGWLGAMASLTSTYAVMPFKEGEYPDARWLDRASLGLVRDLPAPQSAYVTSFYNASKEISQAYADMRHYREMGDAAKVQELLEEKGDKIALAKFYDKTAKNIANVRKQIQLITKDPNMDGAEKKEAIERMKMIMSDLAKQAEEVRKSMKQ